MAPGQRLLRGGGAHSREHHRRFSARAHPPGGLHGHGSLRDGGGEVHVNRIAEAARELLDGIAPEIGDAIVVGVDLHTPYGSSYLVDSPLTGPWATFVTEGVVVAIDERFRTMADREHRAVIGHSGGGFKAVSIALRRPDAFGVVGAASPLALDLAAWILDESGQRAHRTVRSWVHYEVRAREPGPFTSGAAEWSPSPDAPRGYVWPIDIESGALIDEVWQRWLVRSPLTWLDEPAGIARAQRYDQRLFLTCDRGAVQRTFDSTERFHEALERVGIEHAWEPTELGRGESGPGRFEPLIRYVMARVSPQSPVEVASGWLSTPRERPAVLR